jgi:hypothetical protein
MLNVGKSSQFILEKLHLIKLQKKFKIQKDIWIKKEEDLVINMKKLKILQREQRDKRNNLQKKKLDKLKIKFNRLHKKLLQESNQHYQERNLMYPIKQKQLKIKLLMERSM